MIMQRQSNGTYEEIGFIKSKNGENIDTILDAKGNVYFTQGFTREISGIPPLTLDAIGKNTLDYKIYGNSIQNGTPSPDNPVEMQSVGDLVTEGEYTGKYEIPVVTSGQNQKSVTTPIYLDKPLRKIGDYADVLDFKKQQVIRNVSKITSNELSNWRTGTTPPSHWARYPIGHVIPNMRNNVNVVDINVSRFIANVSSEGEGLTYITCRKAYGSNILWIFVPFDVLDNVPVNDLETILMKWRKWVSEHPFIVEYVSNPTTESSDLPQVPTLNGTTIIQTDTKVQPSDLKITYKARK